MVVVDFESTDVRVSYALTSVGFDDRVDRLRSYFVAEKTWTALRLYVATRA